MSSTFVRVATYRCPSCDAKLEAKTDPWADWHVCPNCETPSLLPEPAPMRSRVTAGSFDADLGLAPRRPPGAGRMDWLDAVVPPATASPARPPGARGFVLPPKVDPNAESSKDDILFIAAEPAPVAPPVASTPTPPPAPPPAPRPNPSARPQPTPEQIAAAFTRPARVNVAPRPGTSLPRGRNARIALGSILCVATIAFLVQIMDRQSEFAAVWAMVAVVSLGLLIRVSARPRRR